MRYKQTISIAWAASCLLALATPAFALDLALDTNPDFFTVNKKRYVIVPKDGTVTFSATTDESVYDLSWIFENGSPGSGSTDDPPPVTYGTAALGKLSIVKFSSYRYDEEDNHCVTADKRTCAVVVPQFVTPASGGNPETSPIASGDGQNEFVYDKVTTDALVIELKAKVGAEAAAIAPKLKFEVDPIPGSTLTWEEPDNGGVPKASGEYVTAKAIFTNLPTSNSSFGKKKARLTYGTTMIEEVDYEVFYDAVKKNHPGAGSGSDPNWFYYYKDAVGGGTFTYKAAGRSISQSAGGDSTIQIGNEAYDGDSYILTNVVLGQLEATGWSAETKYFPMFVGVLAHERQHANGEIAGGPPLDADDDDLSNTLETGTSNTDPNDKFSAMGVLTFSDDEIYAGGPVEEEGVTEGEVDAPDVDWAFPGYNSKP